ncbi:MAG: transporter substrate-binding domain-containing protein [Deltaproteobacteria bacterium]|nr:transporter substrate-binding domain-containing protein [Deltaproteobacteria bacterium]
MSSKQLRIPVCCLIIAVILLYVRHLVFPDIFGIRAPEPHPAPAADSNAIILCYHERPPYYATGPLGVYGLCADPAKQAFYIAGISFKWLRLPARRQLEMIRDNKCRACALGWFKNPQREKFACFSLPIYQDKPLIALARADNREIPDRTSLERILANRNLLLLKKNGYSYGTYVDDKIAALKPRQTVTDSENIAMLKMIYVGRADYFFISEEEASYLTRTSGLLQNDFKFVHFSDMPVGNKRYLLFSRKVEKQTIDKLNTALRKLLTGKNSTLGKTQF